MKNTKHQEPMINRKPRLPGDIEEEKPDTPLSDKEKYLRDNDLEVVKWYQDSGTR